MNTLKWRVIVGVVGLTVLSIGTVARSQSTEAKPEILNEEIIKQLQAQIEQLQTIIKTQETEIQRLKALCKKAGIENKPMEKELRRGGGILEFYQKYKNKYALLDGEYIFFPNFDIEYSNSRKGQHPEPYEGYTEEWINHLRGVWELELPKWAVGEYGRGGRYQGFEIFQILGPDEMFIVYDNYPKPKLARFKGWSTKNLIDGERWKGNVRCEENSDEYCGVDIAIVGTYGYTTFLGTPKTILDVVPLELFRKGITLEQFKEMLKTKDELPEELQKIKTMFFL